MQEADSGASGYEYTVGTIDSTGNPSSQPADADVGTMGNLEGLSKLQEPERVSGEAELADLSCPNPAQAAWLHDSYAACAKQGLSCRLRFPACCCQALRQAVCTFTLRVIVANSCMTLSPQLCTRCYQSACPPLPRALLQVGVPDCSLRTKASAVPYTCAGCRS